jgi:glucose-1-phosphate thymidylyltransferase
VLIKGVIAVPPAGGPTGPWLAATRTTSLQRVANRPIVCHVLGALLDAGVLEAAVLTPAEVADEIAACISREGPAGIAVRQLVYEQDEGCAGAMRAAAAFVEDAPCIWHRADGLLGQPLLPFVELLVEHTPDLLMLAQQGERGAKRLRLVTQRPARVAAHQPLGRELVDAAGVYLLGAGTLKRISDTGLPANQLDLSSIAEELANQGGDVQVRVARSWHRFAGDALDLLDMNRIVLDALAPETAAIESDGNRFEGRVVIDPTACVLSSVIVGPVVVGAEALITDAYIGPHTSIGERVRIEGAEIERSIVLADASILHIGGRLVASVVGCGARIFRDFSVPRAMRLQVGDGDEVALC